jgi:hypothetical protein
MLEQAFKECETKIIEIIINLNNSYIHYEKPDHRNVLWPSLVIDVDTTGSLSATRKDKISSQNLQNLL